MNEFLELVKSRRSVRTFDGEMVDESLLSDLRSFAETATNPYKIPVRFAFLEAGEHKLSSPVISGETLYVAAAVEKGEHVEEAYGYTFAALLIRAHKLGLGSVFIGGTMPRDKFEKAAELTGSEIMPCVSPLGGIAQKMSLKESMMRAGVKADKRFDFVNIFFDGNFDTPLSVTKAEEAGIADALECLRLAPSAVNKQPWRVVLDGNKAHFYERHDKGYVTDDYDVQKVDMGIAMFHFDMGLAASGKTAILRVNDPGITIPEHMDYIVTFSWN